MKIHFQKKLQLFFIIMLAGVISVAIATFKTNKSIRDRDELMQQTREVLFESEQLFSNALRLVATSRGYIITGDSVFQQSFKTANIAINESIKKFEKIISNNPTQALRMDSLKKMIEDRIEFSILSMQIRNNSGFNEAKQLITFGKGKYTVLELKKLVDRIQEEEVAFLNLQKDANIKNIEAYNRSFFTLLFIMILFLLAEYLIIRHNFRQRENAEEALSKSNIVLEEMVANRTAELTKANSELKKQTELLSDSGAIAKIGGWDINLENMTLRWTDEVFHIHELEPGTIVSVEAAVNYYAPEARQAIREAVTKAIDHGEGFDLELPFITNKGIHLWVRAIGKTEMNGGKVTRVFGVLNDITFYKLSEQKIVKANRLYHFISQINLMVVHATDDQTLFRDTCNTAINIGKFKMAWIGIVDEQTNKVIPVMQAGEGDSSGYLSEIINISVENMLEGNSPTGTALRKGEYCICNDIENDSSMAPWKEGALKYGYLSSISLPIIKFGKVVGVFSLYASETNFFDEEEVAPLVEATGDISFALENFEKEDQRKKADIKMRASEIQYRRLFEAAKDGILILNAETGVIDDVNPFMVELLGYSHNEFTGKHLWEIGLFRDIFANKEAFQKLQKEKYIRYENLPLKAKDGHVIWVEYVSNAYDVNGRQVIQCNIRDITKAKLAADEHVKSEANLRTIFENTETGFYLLDLEGNIIAFNQKVNQFAKLSFGFELKEKSNLIKSFTPERQDEFAAMLNEITSGSKFYYEINYPQTDGTIIWYTVNANQVLDTSGKGIGICVSVNEITERKKAEEEIQKLATIVQRSPEFISIAGLDSKAIYLNEGGKKIVRLNRDITDTTMFDFIAPPDLKLFQSVIIPAIQEKGRWIGDIRLKNLETKEFISVLMDIFYVLHPVTQKPIAYATISTDITERNRAEETMRLTQFAVDNAGDAIIWMNPDARIVSINEAACRSLGYTRQEFLELSVHDIEPKYDNETWLAFFSDLRKNGSLFFETAQQAKDGHMIPVEIRANYIKFGDKELSCAFIRDISERKKVEQNLELQNKELQKTNTELDRFVYSSSHDLRAPLKSLLGLAELIKEDTDPDNMIQLERMEMMQRSVKKLDDFIEDIVHYSRNTRMEVSRDEIDFEDMIHEIRGNHKFMEGTKGLNLKVEINQTGHFISDKRRINVILNNLISNAIKYVDPSKENSFIKVLVNCTDSNAKIRIEDNGIGIAEKDKEKIFEMFYRATKFSTGSGLGLYIVKETIVKLDGTILVESELNKGTTFTVEIPSQLES